MPSYLNINGIMQSGKADYLLTLGADTINEIAAISPWQKGLVVLQTASTDDFIVRFDTVTRRIVVDEMRVSGRPYRADRPHHEHGQGRDPGPGRLCGCAR